MPFDTTKVQVRRAGVGDRAAWDRFVATSPDSTYAHTWKWMELYRRHGLARPLALIAVDGSDIVGTYGGLLAPLPGAPIARLLRGQYILWSPHELTWDYGGPCLPPTAHEAIGVPLLEAMEVAAMSEGAGVVRVSPLADRVVTLFAAQGYERRERLTALVSLDRREEVWSRTDKHFRYDVRRAQARGLRFEILKGPRHLPEFLECLGPLAARKAFRLPPEQFLEDLLKQDTELLRAWISLVWDPSDRVVAAGISIGHKELLTTRWGGPTDEGRSLAANPFRVWNELAWAGENRFRIVDLGGLPSDPAHGIRRFKLDLGGDTKRVDWYVKYLRMGRLIHSARLLRGRKS